MTTIVGHLSSDELEARYEAAADPVAKSHFHGLWLLSCGYEVEEVAEILSFSPRWVRALLKRYNEGGAEALGDQRIHNGTKPTILTPEALAALKERIKAPPDDGGLWSGPKIARWLAKFHGVRSVHDQRGWDGLIAIGYRSSSRGRAILMRRAKRIVPRSKKLEAAVDEERYEHPGASVEIWAMDEHRIGLKPIVRGVWAPVGERPIALGHHRFEWLYVTGFVEPATGRTVWNIANAVCKELFELILVDFARSVGAGDDKRIVLQLDNAGLARTRKPRRAQRHSSRIPAGRTPLALRRRTPRQPLLRHHREPRSSGRTTLPRSHTPVRHHP